MPKPALVTALTGVAVTQISAGGTHTLFLTLPGLVYCCGANQSGQLGLNRVDPAGADNYSLVLNSEISLVKRIKTKDREHLSGVEIFTPSLSRCRRR